MKIGGYQKCSLIDYPGKVAAVVFTQGCDWRCPFCHNRSLVNPSRFQPSVPESEIFDHLRSRHGKLDGVVVTGGEPTLQSGLADFLRQMKALRYLTKLDTNGSRPDVLAYLFAEKLVDYVAMDLKGPFNQYSRFAGREMDTGPLELSIELIRRSGIDYEFRTTLVGGLHTLEDIQQMVPLVKGAARYAAQTYRAPPEGNGPFFPPSPELFHAVGSAVRDQVAEFLVR